MQSKASMVLLEDHYIQMWARTAVNNCFRELFPLQGTNQPFAQSSLLTNLETRHMLKLTKLMVHFAHLLVDS